MRLLNTDTFEIHQFFGDTTPTYAILSHRWEEDEVSFQDVRDRQNLNAYGWSKVNHCCALAKRNGHSYVWIDTCCIEKTSSAELNEAINSMFRWYQNAKVCYAYLNDVPSGLGEGRKKEAALRKSKWFTRGWTLQELIAPSRLYFISSDWTENLGTKASLDLLISEITGISRVSELNTGNLPLSTVSVAARMSWVSRRTCTRAEDYAYCLMGIFGVYMPMMYGEGENAFMRLQLEILKVSEDESIFAWDSQNNTSYDTTGLLAPSPRLFANSGNIRSFTITGTDGPVELPYDAERPPYAMTNRGLQMEPLILPYPTKTSKALQWEMFLLPLNCFFEVEERGSLGGNVPVVLILEQMTWTPAEFRRAQAYESIGDGYKYLNMELFKSVERRLIYVRQPHAMLGRA
jgi:hypothetical protein